MLLRPASLAPESWKLYFPHFANCISITSSTVFVSFSVLKEGCPVDNDGKDENDDNEDDKADVEVKDEVNDNLA